MAQLSQNDEPPLNFIQCSSCQVPVSSTERNLHYRSDWHRYNVKRRCVNMPPISQEIFNAKLAAIVSRSENAQYQSKSMQRRNQNEMNVKNEIIKNDSNTMIEKNESNENNVSSSTRMIFDASGQRRKQLLSFYCKLCHKVFKTQQQIESHLNTKKHTNLFHKYIEMLQLMQKEHAYDAISMHSKNNNNKNKKKNPKKRNKNKITYVDEMEMEHESNDIVEFENELYNELEQAQPGARNNINNANGLDLTPNGKQKNANENQGILTQFGNLPLPSDLGLTEAQIFEIMNEKKLQTTIKNNPFCQISRVDIGASKQFGSKKLEFDSIKTENDEMQTEGATIETGGTTSANEEIFDQDGAIPVRHCLFCTQSFDCLEDVMSHMTQKHGFFIPFEKRLKSLHGLLMQAGKVIGTHHQCVWCWKGFASLKGVQMHMRTKSHCKLQIDYGSHISTLATITDNEDDNDMLYNDIEMETNGNNENNDNKTDTEDLEESESEEVEQGVTPRNIYLNPNGHSPFAQYFDWSAQGGATSVSAKSNVSPGKPKNNLDGSIIKFEEYNPRRVCDVNDFDELVRFDGSVIGHRENRIVYKQKIESLRKETQTEEQIISQLNNPNKKFMLEQMVKDQEHEKFENAGGKEHMMRVKEQREDSFYKLDQRSYKMGINQFKSQNRMLY